MLKYETIREKQGEEAAEAYRQKLFSQIEAIGVKALKKAGIEMPEGGFAEIIKQIDNDPELASKVELAFNNEAAALSNCECNKCRRARFLHTSKKWRSGVFYTDAEKILAQRVGANLQAGLMITDEGEKTKEEFLKWATTSLSAVGVARPSGAGKQFAGTSAAAISSNKAGKINAGDSLIFGHSQSGETGMGGALESYLENSGTSVTRITINGASDNSLADRLNRKPKNDIGKHFVFKWKCL